MPLNVDGKDAPAAVDVPADRPATSAAHRVSFTDQHERRVSQLGAEGEVTAAQRRRSVTQSDDGGKAAADGTTKSERKLKRSSTMTQAKFAARMASKMKHRQEDKRTKAKDRWLVATGVSGLDLYARASVRKRTIIPALSRLRFQTASVTVSLAFFGKRSNQRRRS